MAGHACPSPASLILPSVPTLSVMLGAALVLSTPSPLPFLPSFPLSLALVLPAPPLGTNQLPEPSLPVNKPSLMLWIRVRR